MRTSARLGGALILLLGVAACDALPGKPTAADRPLRPDQVVDFDQLYGNNCSGCHGANGTLAGARPLNDPVYLAIAGSDRLRAITAQGVPNSLMPGFATTAGGTLTDQQIAIVVGGMVSRWGSDAATRNGPPPAYAASAPGDAQRGAAAFATYCASCHGDDGGGGRGGASVVDASYLALVSDQALRTAVICGRVDLGMPDWRGDVPGQPMSEANIADIVAWLTAHRQRFPGQPYPHGE